jgi:hypothetical protein
MDDAEKTKQRPIERWENEGGMIPKGAPFEQGCVPSKITFGMNKPTASQKAHPERGPKAREATSDPKVRKRENIFSQSRGAREVKAHNLQRFSHKP